MRHVSGPIMVIGCKGMLGTDLCSALSNSDRVFVGVDLPEVNISDETGLIDVCNEVKPAVIVNTAAITDVDGCENQYDEAYRVNALGALSVAKAAQSTGAFLVHLSTDYVFDGEKTTPYQEDDPLSPLGVYGRTKAEGERLIMEQAPNSSLIVRTQWLYGLRGKNFVESILKACRERDVLKVVSDQHGRPTFTEDLAEALIKLMDLRPAGICHVANSGQTTWHGFASAIVELEGLKGIRVEELTTAELNRPAPRPLYSILDLSKFQSLTNSGLRDWKQALKVYLEERKRLKG